VQDIGEVIKSSAEALPAKYSKVVSFVEHDFFQPQSTVADCYLLRFILHNWSDAEAKKILASLYPALRPGARLIIVDNAMPVSEAPSYVEKYIRNMDIGMYSLLAGRERTEADFVELAENADSRLRLESCHRPAGSIPSIFVFRFGKSL
jgi:6-hydroxytryprostatin B O-methyltransferase